jgi:hypothetical protein
LLLANDAETAGEVKVLLDIYRHSWYDDNIDIDLVMTILQEVHSSRDKGNSKKHNGCIEDSSSLKADSS